MNLPFPRYLFLLALLLAAGGCQTDSAIDDLLEGRQIDYEEEDSQKQQRLQYPPDLLSGAQAIEGTVSLSEYTIESVPVIEEAEEVAVEAPAVKVRYQRSGNLRWVEVDLPPNEVWGLMRGFWVSHLGFGLAREEPALGVAETDWLNLRERVAAPGWLNEYLDEFLNRLHDSGERDKFAVRLEKNDAGGTDIYVTHRHIVARFDGDGLFSGYESQDSDVGLEIEMMRRMMLFFSGRAELKDAVAADISEDIAEAEAEVVSDYRHEGATLYISKPFYDSWQLVQVALNRGGFSIEDRDFQEGIIYIRHSGGPDSDKIFGKAETNFFNRLFGEQRPILRDIQLIFEHDNGDEVRLTTAAAEGDAPLTELQSSVVLELLYEYLP